MVGPCMQFGSPQKQEQYRLSRVERGERKHHPGVRDVTDPVFAVLGKLGTNQCTANRAKQDKGDSTRDKSRWYALCGRVPVLLGECHVDPEQAGSHQE